VLWIMCSGSCALDHVLWIIYGRGRVSTMVPHSCWRYMASI